MDESVILYAVLFVVSFVLCEVARSVLTTADRCAVTDLFVSLCLTFSATQRFFLKFFLKCNQNCLKNAGNPRDMRRFQVSMLYIMQARTDALPGTLCHCCFANNQTCKSILRLKTNKAFTGSYSHKQFLCFPCRGRVQCSPAVPKDMKNCCRVINVFLDQKNELTYLTTYMKLKKYYECTLTLLYKYALCSVTPSLQLPAS